MARIRFIKPELFNDEELGALSMAARYAFIGLWCHADRDGRLESRPLRLKLLVLPFDNVDMAAVVDELVASRFLLRYRVDGKDYLQIRSWGKHQRPHLREVASVIPPMPTKKHNLGSAKAQPRQCSSTTQAMPSPLDSGVLILESGLRMTGDSSEALTRSEPAADAVLEFPTVGPQRSWGLTGAQVAAWAELFPTSDVRAQCQQALAWVQANPSRRKTARGMPSFLVSWLGRSVDRGRAGPTMSLTKSEHRSAKNAASLAAVIASLEAEERAHEPLGDGGDGRLEGALGAGSDAGGILQRRA